MADNNQLFSNFDTTKIFVWGNRYQAEDYTNSGYTTKELALGTVMSRYLGTNRVVPFDSTDVKANVPIGVLAADYEVANGDTVEVQICDKGDVVSGKLVFENGTDTLDTVLPSGLTVKDVLQGQSVGIKIVESTELTGYDNA